MIEPSMGEYVAAVLAAHKAGTIDAHLEYTAVHSGGNQQGEHGPETDIQFIVRCAEQDWGDGSNSWIFLELFPKLYAELYED